MINKLLPCPLCGSENVEALVIEDHSDRSKVECIDCECDVYADNFLLAKKKWNNRNDTLIIRGDYPTAKCWEKLQKFAESKGVNFFVEGISPYQIMQDLVEKGIGCLK